MNGLKIDFISKSGASVKIYYPCAKGSVMPAYIKTVKLIRRMYDSFRVIAIREAVELEYTAENWKM